MFLILNIFKSHYRAIAHLSLKFMRCPIVLLVTLAARR